MMAIVVHRRRELYRTEDILGGYLRFRRMPRWEDAACGALDGAGVRAGSTPSAVRTGRKSQDFDPAPRLQKLAEGLGLGP
jgi:hypothetical protein